MVQGWVGTPGAYPITQGMTVTGHGHGGGWWAVHFVGDAAARWAGGTKTQIALNLSAIEHGKAPNPGTSG